MSNITITGDNVVVVNGGKRTVVINGEEIPFHPKMTGRSMSTISGKTYIDGFEYINGKWKRTLRGIWYTYIT